MLSYQSLTRRFGSNIAVDAVSFDVPDGQLVGVIGRSGAGKSTLLRMTNRLLDPSDGAIIFQDRDVTALTGAKKRAWQSECAMIFQQFNLVPRLDVLTNVILGRLNEQSTTRSILKFFTKEERERAVMLLDRFGIAQTALQRAETLSGGQQQRVAICRAMMQNPGVVLADEPIASLDPLNARLVMEALQDINREEKITVICNLHTLDTARTYCDRIVGMRDGAVVFDGTGADLTDEMAREIYGAEANEAFEGTITSTALGEIPRVAAE
ncbi:MAG: phosphonate ABC transporter ATP-binding protein [Pseudomonadota bacterium]